MLIKIRLQKNTSDYTPLPPPPPPPRSFYWNEFDLLPASAKKKDFSTTCKLGFWHIDEVFWHLMRDSDLLSPSLEYFMHCTIYAIREKRRKTSVVQDDSKVTLHTIRSLFSLDTSYESCLAWQCLVLNRTNHKLHMKLINQKRWHMSLRLCGIRTRYCTLIRRRSIQSVCYAG